MAAKKPFQLLEISVMSAQDLEPVAKKMKTYATAWVHSGRKLSTRVDAQGNNNPSWNDKFVFRVNEDFLIKDTSAIMIDIYSTGHWFRDLFVGNVRVLVSDLITPPPESTSNRYNNGTGMRCVALQVRRPSGRPQGILNIGVSVLDGSMRSMPLYRQLSASAVGYRDLMGFADGESQCDNDSRPTTKPMLFRSRSEKSAIVDRSAIGGGTEGEGRANGKTRKASSVVSGAELERKPKAVKKARSVLSSGSTFGNRTILPPPKPSSSILSGSEVGPSPSEVAALMMIMERRYPLEDEMGSSVLEGWSVDDSEEGLKSKLDRWRTEMPPLYDRGYSTSTFETTTSSRRERRRRRRHSDGGDAGLFSFFGNVCGIECQCVCGKPASSKSKSKSKPKPSRDGRLNSPSIASSGGSSW